MKKHKPEPELLLPWRVDEEWPSQIVTDTDRPSNVELVIAELPSVGDEQDSVRAAYIVKSANCHADLVSFIENARAWAKRGNDKEAIAELIGDYCAKLIAKARSLSHGAIVRLVLQTHQTRYCR